MSPSWHTGILAIHVGGKLYGQRFTGEETAAELVVISLGIFARVYSLGTRLYTLAKIIDHNYNIIVPLCIYNQEAHWGGGGGGGVTCVCVCVCVLGAQKKEEEEGLHLDKST